MAGAAFRSLISALALGMAYLLFWPVVIEPVAWAPSPAPGLEGDYARNDLLAAAEYINIGQGQGLGQGPEDIAFGPDGRLYTGLSDGSIVSIDMATGEARRFAETGGRPAGMVFEPGGNLIVADVRRGLLSVSEDGGVRVLVDKIDGRRMLFANDLDIGSDGVVYFSESSSRYTPDHINNIFLEHGGDGALHAYDLNSGALTTILRGLTFANGVALNADESAVYAADLGSYQVHRVWLRGARAGTSEIFLDNLPGFPDNLNTGSGDTLWIALGVPRNRLLDALAAYPFARKILARLPGMTRFESQPIALQVNSDGRVIRNLQNSDPKAPILTSVYEREGVLYFGNLFSSGVHRMAVPD